MLEYSKAQQLNVETSSSSSFSVSSDSKSSLETNIIYDRQYIERSVVDIMFLRLWQNESIGPLLMETVMIIIIVAIGFAPHSRKE